MGKAKIAPHPEHTVPRLELCAAVLAVELAELITSEMDIDLKDIQLYTDSKVVLGYIYNETRRFYVYVNNSVLRIRRATHLTQWRYVPTDHNPADHATRAVAACNLKYTTWFTGPAFLYNAEQTVLRSDTIELVDPDSDADICPEILTFQTATSDCQLKSNRFTRFSKWKMLV